MELDARGRRRLTPVRLGALDVGLDAEPYKRKDELVQKKIMPQGIYDKIKDQIVAKQK